MSTTTPVAFEIQRVGQKPERISADSLETEGTPAKYVFRRKGRTVLDIFTTALEREPKPILPSTPEANAKWRAFVKKQDSLNKSPHLQR
jgi:hypothetical protein